ncbi:hypothetical protein MNBD_GAMMA18-1929 [hydrothermal vent metagenome]|uniref:DUF4124 domain-containing protein n=1 Tax=hydrothermal vent metagenome TaxID=652676 RepID=A0A3B0ZAZ4_9ZZZZ
MKQIKLLLLIGMLLPALAVAGEVYKWVDEEGNVHFGDRPQPNVKAETVKIDKHTPDQHYRDRMQSIKQNAESRREASVEKKVEQQKLSEQNTSRCQDAKRRLYPLKQKIRVFNYDDAGERKYIDDEDRTSKIKALEAIVKASCK